MQTRTGTIAVPAAALTNLNYTTPALFGEFLGMLSDRQTLIFRKSGSEESALGVSANKGVTVTWGKNFGGGSYKIVGFIETPNGELLISTEHKTKAAVGQVWRSTGWNKATADATTWTVVTTAPLGVAYDGRWGFNERCVIRTGAYAGRIIIAQYGMKVSEAITAGRATTESAVFVKMSTDDGLTWTTIFDLRDKYPGLNAQLHVHGVAIDSYDNRVLISSGDGGFGDGGECAIWYCNFENLSAPVWTEVPGTRDTNPRQKQCTTIAPLSDQILLASDSEVGAVRRIARRGYRNYGPLSEVIPLGAGVIGANIYTDPNRRGAPVFVTYQNTAATPSHNPASFVVTRGQFKEAHREASAVNSSSRGIINMCGPDVNGKVYGNRQLSGTTVFVSADFTADGS